MEKKLTEERKNRQNIENQLNLERAKKKSEEEAAARAIALAAAQQQQPPPQRSTTDGASSSASADTTSSAASNGPTSTSSGAAAAACCHHLEELESVRADLSKLRQDKLKKEDDLRHLESEASQLRQYKDNGQSETEVLMSALSAMQDKINQLENSLSSETRLKQDLFSALGESKRQFASKSLRCLN